MHIAKFLSVKIQENYSYGKILMGSLSIGHYYQINLAFITNARLNLHAMAQFHQLGVRRKLQKARLFIFSLQCVFNYNTTQLFEVYALR